MVPDAEDATDRLPRRSAPEVLWSTGLGVAVLVLGLAGQRILWSTAVETAGWMVAAAPAVAALGVALQLLYRFADGAPLAPYLRRLRAPGWWLEWLRLWLACWVTSFAYFWLKVYVPRLRDTTYDPALASLERALHFGIAPTAWFAEGIDAPLVLATLDAWYALWLPSVVWCLAFFAAAPDPAVRRGVVLSCLSVWLVGSWLYVSVPVLGPVYAYPEMLHDTFGRMPRAAAAQDALRRNLELVRAGAAPEAFQHTLGVAALPSLHVAFHTLFALWARRAAPLLFWPFVVATVATLIGSVATGWHYAIDGYVGIALASVAVGLSIRLIRSRQPSQNGVT